MYDGGIVIMGYCMEYLIDVVLAHLRSHIG